MAPLETPVPVQSHAARSVPIAAGPIARASPSKAVVPEPTQPLGAGHGCRQASVPVPALDLHALLLEVVSDKTGYPSEMLTMEMDLEGDLGIDSIKRVEILSAMDELAPGLPELDITVMAKLATLGQVVEYMNEQLAAAGSRRLRQLSATSAPSAAVQRRP